MDARHLIADTNAVAASYRARLAQDGYCIIPDVMPRALVEALDRDLSARFAATPYCRGIFYGERTKRFGSLLKRARAADAFVRHPLVLGLVESVLAPFCDRIQLNLTQAIEIHPGADAQLPHRDQEMWGGPKGAMEYLVNVMWPLTPFTADNGATMLWPASHRDQSQRARPPSEAVAALMQPGSVLLFLGSTLHQGGANRSAAPRRGMLISYCLGWLRQFEAQMLIYPPSVARDFSPELAALIGYAIHRPNLGNYEGQSPFVLLEETTPEFLQAQDALTPEQDALIAQLTQARTPPTEGDRRAKILEAAI